MKNVSIMNWPTCGWKWLLAFSLCLSYTSCTENIDESNFAIKNEQTAADFLDENPDLSLIKEVLQKVDLCNIENASSIYSNLTARGNYTLFLPSNAAVQKTLDANGASCVDSLDIVVLDAIAKSCIIDNEDNTAYTTADFPVDGTFPRPNLSDRLLSCKMHTGSEYLINGVANITEGDIKVSNGYIHLVDNVIAPSISTLDALIEQADNLKVFTHLLKKTTWNDSLYEIIDKKYEEQIHDEMYIYDNSHKYQYAPHRYLGYTAFVENDSVYETTLGVTKELDSEGNLLNGDQFVTALENKLAFDYGTEAAGNYANPDNAINKFVAYHLVEGRLSPNNMAIHRCEYGYKGGADPSNPQTVNCPINVWSFFTTMGKYRRLLKVTQVGDQGFEHDLNHTTYVNRLSLYNNGPKDDYTERGIIEGFEGCAINFNNGENDNNSINGFYYPINKLLVYSKTFANHLGNERLRFDFCSLLSELYSNNYINSTTWTCFPRGYFKNAFFESQSTMWAYMIHPTFNVNVSNGDEFEAQGVYDVTFRLPPVPIDGTYEIRLNTSQNYIVRSMCQVYFGENPSGLQPAGLPVDLRISVGPDMQGSIPWFKDTDDWAINFENEKQMRNKGYMKGTNYQGSERTARSLGGTFGVVRKILTTADMQAGKTYYIRFKTALNRKSRMWLDYFEFTPKSVYNGAEREDIW